MDAKTSVQKCNKKQDICIILGEEDIMWINLTDADLTKGSKLTSSKIGHPDILYFLMWYTKKCMTSFLRYSFQKCRTFI
jgi:hypothetical protein